MLYGGVDTVRCCGYLCGTVQSKIPQSGTMESQAVPASSLTWEKFFAHIPIQEQKETKFAYDAQRTIEGYLPCNVGLSIQKMLESNPFLGHLIAENMNGVIGLTPVHVVHHIAYDNGNEASLIYQLLHVEEEDDNNVHEGPFHTHSLFALQQGLVRKANAVELSLGSADSNCFPVPRWEELLLFTIDNFQDGSFQYSFTEADRLSVTNGIIAIPPFMTVALVHANSRDSKVLCLAAVEAIRHVLENGVEEDKVVQQDMLMHLKYIPQWLFLVSTVSLVDATFGIEVEWFDRGDNTFWLHEPKFNLRRGYANNYAIELQDTTLHQPNLLFL